MSRFTRRFLSDSGALSRRAVSLGLAVGLFASVNLMSGCLSRSLTGLTIEPGTGETTIIPGVTAQFKAIGTYTEGGHETTTEDLTDEVQWSTTIPDVASVNNTGLVTGAGVGITSVIATINGSFGNLTAVSNVTVNAPSGSSGSTTRSLTSVTMVPSSQTLTAAGQQAQFLAIGTYNIAPTSANLTSSATWTSSDPSVATVGTTATHSAGLVTAVGAGTATITALATGPDGSVVQANGTVTVSISTSGTPVRTLTSINIDPGAQTLNSTGETAQLIAIGNYTASPFSADLSSSATWQTSDSSVATVNSSGLVTAVGTGTAVISALGTAADGSVIVGNATITVSSSTPSTRTLTSLTLLPFSQTLTTIGQTAQFLALGTYSQTPTSGNLTDNATWGTSDPSVATVSSTGLVTAVGQGTATITSLATGPDGSVLGASGTVTVNITPSSSTARTLTSVTIDPGSQTLYSAGQTTQLIAIGSYTASPLTANLTSTVTWQSSNESVATVNSSGLVTGAGAGSAVISALGTAADGSVIVGTAVVTVDASTFTTRTLTALSIVPQSQTLVAVGQAAQFLAVGTYSAAPTSADLTNTSTWESSDTSVATVNNTGVVTAVGAGTATIIALASGPDSSVLEATGTVTVDLTPAGTTGRTLTAVNVSPGDQTLTAAGQTAQMIAIGSFTSSPTSADLTDTASWQSSDTSIATVNSTGLVTAVAPGSATITAIGTAADGSVYAGNAVVTVESTTPVTRILTGLQVIPQTQPTTITGETSQFLAIGTYNVAPFTEDLTDQVTWVSSDTYVATVDNAGLATTVGTTIPSQTTITALATDSDGNVLSASGTLQMVQIQSNTGPGSSNLPSLGIYGAGAGSGTVTSSPGAISCAYTGPSSGAGAGSQSSAQCTGSFSSGTAVTLTEVPATGTKFDGWSGNCTAVVGAPTDPTSGQPTECTITLTGNDTVGAIFDPQ